MLREMLWEKDNACECVHLNETEEVPEHCLLLALCGREAASSWLQGLHHQRLFRNSSLPPQGRATDSQRHSWHLLRRS